MPGLVERGPEAHEYRPNASRSARSGANGLFVIVWIAFGVLVWVSPETLQEAWTWIRELPIVLEVLAWVLLLPWMVAFLVVNSSLALWLRWVIVLALAVVTIGGSSSARRRAR